MLHVSAPLPLLPPELADFQPILDRLLAKEPQQRFADGAQLIDALRRLPRQALRRGDAFLARRRQRRVLPLDDEHLSCPPPRRGFALALVGLVVATAGGAGLWLKYSGVREPAPAAPSAVVAAPSPASAATAAPLQGVEARAAVLEAALQTGWRLELETELAQLYQDWLEADPSATAPRVALMRLQQRALDRVQEQFDAGRKSGPALEQLATRYPELVDTEVFRQLERQLAEPPPHTSPPERRPDPVATDAGAISSAPAEEGPRLPEVMKLAVTADPDGAAAGEPVLTPARTLYVAFEYHHFRPAATVLQAVLFDGARTYQLAAVPVVVNGGAGTQRFRIDRPVDGFGSGGYHLDLFAEGVLLASAEFVVRAVN
jgi:hypothetical protein